MADIRTRSDACPAGGIRRRPQSSQRSSSLAPANMVDDFDGLGSREVEGAASASLRAATSWPNYASEEETGSLLDVTT